MQPGFPSKMIASLGLIGAVAACDLTQPTASVPTGAEDFATFCVPCHGPGGVGDGPLAAGLVKAPADLTAISARSGGSFPQAQVMSKIWGYTRQNGQVMPGFAALLKATRCCLIPATGSPPRPRCGWCSLANICAGCSASRGRCPRTPGVYGQRRNARGAQRAASDVEFLHKPCIFLDILKAQFRLLAHQALDQIGGLARLILVDADPDQFAGRGVHGGVFQILGVHLA